MMKVYSIPVVGTVYGIGYIMGNTPKEAFEVFEKYGVPEEAVVWDEADDVNSSCGLSDLEEVVYVPDGVCPFGAEQLRIQYQQEIAHLEEQIQQFEKMLKESKAALAEIKEA